MRHEHEAMKLVRADLCQRFEALQRFSARRGGDRVESIVTIRRLAAAYGLDPVVRIAEAMERSIREQPGNRTAALYMDRLYDAIGCERSDPAAGEAMLASVSVRFGG
jgi:hypothetical protein